MNTYFKKKQTKNGLGNPQTMTDTPKLATNFEILNNINFTFNHRMLRATVRSCAPKMSRKYYDVDGIVAEVINVQDYYDMNTHQNIMDLEQILVC